MCVNKPNGKHQILVKGDLNARVVNVAVKGILVGHWVSRISLKMVNNLWICLLNT